MTRLRYGLLVALTLAAALWSAQPALADARDERPWQVQFDTGGLTLGYHINQHFYVGVTHQPELWSGDTYSRRYRDDSDAEIYGQDGVQHENSSYASRTSVEARWTPWSFGLYFAAGVLATGGDRQKIDYDSRFRVIGDNAYSNTSLRVSVKDPSQTAPAVGVGYNHVFPFGLSLSGGILFATRRSDVPDVKVTVLNGSVLQSDLDAFKHRIEDDNRGPQGMLHLAVGYNF